MDASRRSSSSAPRDPPSGVDPDTPSAAPPEVMAVGRQVVAADPPSTPAGLAPPRDDSRDAAGALDAAGGAPDLAPDPARGDVRGPDGGDPAGRRRLLRVAGAIVALVVVAGLALGDGDPSPAWTTPLPDGGPRLLDPVPDTAITDRWDLRLDPSRSLVGLAVLDRHVLVANLARPGLRRRDVLTVSAHDTLDGRPLWSRDVADATSAVVVVGASGQVVLPTAGSDVAAREEPTGDRGRLVALDDRDGTVAWSVALAGDNVVRDHPERASVVVHGADRVTEYDVATGRRLHDFPRLVNGDPADARVDPAPAVRLVDDAWVVPVADGWEVVDDVDGTTRSLPSSDLAPVLVGDLAITVAGRDVTAHDRDGATAWSASLPAPVVEVTRPGPEVLALAGVAGDVGTAVLSVTVSDTVDGYDRTTHLLDTDGRDLVAVPTGIGALDEDLVVGVEVAGGARLLCLGAPEWIHDRAPDVPGPCPDRLGLLDRDGRVLARQGDVDLAAANWPIEPVLTQSGPILHERGRLRLYRWEGLTPAWSIPVDLVDTQPVLVGTSTRGVVVGSNHPLPATVTWYG